MSRNAPWLFGLALCACAEDPAGDLDADVVSALAKQVGDARGVASSGVYGVELTPLQCGCTELDPSLWALTLCQRGAFGPVGVDATIQTTFDVVTSDGIVDLASEAATANPVGALQADGSFDAGAVIRLTSLAATGYQITRVEGWVEPSAELGNAIEGTVALRIIGRVELLGIEGVVTGVEDIDCTESLAFSGTRYIVR